MFCGGCGQIYKYPMGVCVIGKVDKIPTTTTKTQGRSIRYYPFHISSICFCGGCGQIYKYPMGVCVIGKVDKIPTTTTKKHKAGQLGIIHFISVAFVFVVIVVKYIK